MQFKHLATLILTLFLSGCEIGYYSHLAQGQWAMVRQRQAISSLLKQKDIDPQLKQRLQLSQDLIAFSKSHLKMQIDGQYSTYIDLKRPSAIYSLVAAPELSLTPYEWCYPIIGCASYRGFYDLERANAAAKKLKDQGYEISHRGVSAYSTLGWFKDPLLNTFIGWKTQDFIELIFHELAHSQVYIQNDTAFNESFASFVGQEGLKHWYASQGLVEQLKPTETNHFALLMVFLKPFQNQLQTLYASNQSDAEKRVQKQIIYDSIQAGYLKLSSDWGSNSKSIDAWMSRLNNAQMASIADYTQWVESFEQLFRAAEQDWEAFYQSVAALGALSASERHRQLKRLGEQQIPALPFHSD